MKLTEIYNEIETLNDEIPAQLSRKITLYSQALMIIGRYHAQAIRDHGRAYADRKNKWGQAIQEAQGTGKEKEGAAEIACYEERKREADAEMEVWKWRNTFQATQEIINAIKIEQKTMMKEYDNVG